MARRDRIVIGGSAGSIEVLLEMVRNLPGDLPAAVFIVVHVAPYGESVLPTLLGRAGRLPAAHARHNEAIVPGRIYVAPPDQHLTLAADRVLLSRSARENHARPAIDPLFRSAASVFGPRVIGIVLSGMLDDGTIGMMAVKRHGGLTICQDPREALYPSMPRNAIEHVDVDHVGSVAEIVGLLSRLAVQDAPVASGERSMSNEIEQAGRIIRDDMNAQAHGQRHGMPSIYTCPACGGVLWQLDEYGISRFQCHTGHIYSIQHLLVDQAEALESALWQAIRALQQKSILARQTVREECTMSPNMRARFEEQALASEANADLLMRLVQSPIFSPTQEELNAEGTSAPPGSEPPEGPNEPAAR